MEALQKSEQFVKKTKLGIIEVLAEEVKQKVNDSIDRLSNNPRIIEIVSSYAYIKEFYLRKCAEEHPEYANAVRKKLIGFF